MTRYGYRDGAGRLLYRGRTIEQRRDRKRIRRAWGYALAVTGSLFAVAFLAGLPWFAAAIVAALLGQLALTRLTPPVRRVVEAPDDITTPLTCHAPGLVPSSDTPPDLRPPSEAEVALAEKTEQVRIAAEAGVPYLDFDDGTVWTPEQCRAWLDEQRSAREQRRAERARAAERAAALRREQAERAERRARRRGEPEPLIDYVPARRGDPGTGWTRRCGCGDCKELAAEGNGDDCHHGLPLLVGCDACEADKAEWNRRQRARTAERERERARDLADARAAEAAIRGPGTHAERVAQDLTAAGWTVQRPLAVIRADLAQVHEQERAGRIDHRMAASLAAEFVAEAERAMSRGEQ